MAHPAPSTTQLLHRALAADRPIFSCSRVHHTPPAPVSLIVASNLQIQLVLANKCVQRINQAQKTPEGGASSHTVDLGPILGPSRIARAWLDPLGAHLVLSTKPNDPEGQPDLLYLHRDRDKPKFSSKFKGVGVTAVAWHTPNTSESTTGPILLGTATGVIWETELSHQEERFLATPLEAYTKLAFDLGQGQYTPITGLEYHRVPHTQRYFILATTPHRLYQFLGKVGSPEERPLLQHVFQNYAQRPDKFLELPSSLKTSTLSMFYQVRQRGQASAQHPLYPVSFGWLTGSCVYTGKIDALTAQADTVTVDCQMMTFPRVSGSETAVMPRAFLITEFHAIYAYETTVRGECLLNEQIVFETELDVSSGKIRGMARDPVIGSFYVYCDYGIYKFKVEREERNIWQIYLEQNEFDLAQQFCLGDELKLEVVNARRAEDLFDQGRYLESAMHFAKTRRSFESIALKFMQIDEKSALLNYLKRKLETAKMSDRMQVSLIVVWIIEIYVSRLRQIQREGLSPDLYQQTHAEFRALLENPKIKPCLTQNKNALYDLLSVHGDKDNLVRFAEIMGDHDQVIRYHLQNDRFEAVLQILKEQRQPELYYKYGPDLMRNMPQAFVDALIEQGLKLAPARLIPSLVVGTAREQELESIRYIEHCIRRLDNKGAALHNYLVALYIKHQPEKMEEYLAEQGADPEDDLPYDVNYTLHLCQGAGLIKECVRLYCLLGQLDEAIDLALTVDLEQAKRCLEFAHEEDDQRKIWLRIAKFVVQQKNDIKQAMDCLKECQNLVNIEDILPFFPDFVTIDHFKDAICDSLQEYSKHIQDLRDEMDESNKAADGIRQEIQEYKNRYIFVKATETCSVCHGYLMARGFHLFNCGHKFHTDCLVKEIMPYLSSGRRRKVDEIQAEMTNLRLDHNDEDTQSVDSRTVRLSRKDQLRNDLDELIANECLFCGELMVKMIDRPFIEDHKFEQEVLDWL
ncbi:hypothetical protein TCAL_00267 [Tigriopus californicus]|uniref:Vacuolar protein sorting-associated protein 18 homolog n=1 Tax=Tigriopus californicus TaxID=6832 RepID=A0A553P4W3_TIGCA|nr:vacuolar protein sorting-associated protein 18 homolog [Tigriopus californicus]TRY72729.1 hypothetical protein TCAL_00267 [Tigriopus californicus]|eukprot:TCALIF_00267-PA protein Name:"Similar to vps18 Vacuolar protein sorting-associated protein 18 homolog (Danio rerio)" AED:0.20 eAED:0.20 QI:0/-1/0/1/-1/1/1/0/972